MNILFFEVSTNRGHGQSAIRLNGILKVDDHDIWVRGECRPNAVLPTPGAKKKERAANTLPS